MTSELKASRTLESELMQSDCSPKLKNLISRYITSMQRDIKGVGNFTNITYRGNLHYIQDNLSNPSLATELEAICHD
jgi:hypothetical protein